MNLKNKTLAINSLLILISISIIGTILHEFAHYITAISFGLHPELHHNYVKINPDNGTKMQNMLIAAAGPLFSLIFGIIILYISKKIFEPSLLKLSLLWLGLYNILIFLGYLLIAPISKSGDTGKVFEYFNTPNFIIITIAIVALILITKLFIKISNEFRYYKNEGGFNIDENSKQLFLLPIIGSIIIFTIMNLPVVIWVSLLPTVFMPMAFFRIMRSYKKLNLDNAIFEVNKISLILVIATTFLTIGFRYLI